MAINIEKAFNTDNLSVHSYMSQSGQGLYIPLYQREYSWDDDNIIQLLEDITKGVIRIIEGNKDEIRFLGTIITVKETNNNNLYPIDPQGIPACVEKIIDGQQRLSTIVALGCILCKNLDDIDRQIKDSNPLHDTIHELCDYWIQKLLEIISFDLGRGTPKRKPKIIRGSIDFWTKDKKTYEAYRSPISRLLADSISAILNHSDFPNTDKDTHGIRLTSNVKKMETWIKNIRTAHKNPSDEYPRAIDILESYDSAEIIMYDRSGQEFDFKKIISGENNSFSEKEQNTICELVQICAICSYLLNRCCFTIIQPTNDDWAFDMFQSLNATGTPLTAIETFKPLVVNYTNGLPGSDYKGSENEKSLNMVEELFDGLSSAQQKSKLTNDFLTSFYVAYEGSAISSHFSHQRKALNNSFDELITPESKEKFLNFFGRYAYFYKHIWNEHNFNEKLDIIKNSTEGELTTLLISFLKESKHKMAITVLATFYSQICSSEDNLNKQAFIDATKAIVAFYILWRSAGSNAGLDNVYRELFKHSGKRTSENHSLELSTLKEHFRNALAKKEVPDTFNEWVKLASLHLVYNEASVICRLILFMAFHCTIPDNDENKIGLIKKGHDGVNPFLTLDKWNSTDLKTVEHIAPQNNDNEWDKAIYDNERPLKHSLGNLTLLPQDINSSVGNKGWEEKILYYNCIGNTEEQEFQVILNKAKKMGIELNLSTVELLRECKYSPHMDSIISVYEHKCPWNSLLIQKRTECILKLAWDTFHTWLY